MIDVWENRPFRISPNDREHLSKVLSLERRGHGWMVSGVVGHVALPSGETLRIRSSKAKNASILAWAAYVDPTLAELRFLDVTREGSREGDLAGLIGRLFVREALFAAHRTGLVRQYQRVRTKTSTLRGKVDFASLARQSGELSRVPCIVWERLPETPLNRFLAEALRRVRRDPVMATAAGGELRRAEAVWKNVRPMVDPGLLHGRTALDRTETPFATACALARLVLRHSALTEGTGHLGTSFLVHLDTLFEKAVVMAFRDAGVRVRASAPLPYERRDPRSSVAAGEGSFSMDLFLGEPPWGPLVVDAKYKKKVDSANLHQMISYCFLSGAKRAVLVFPKGHLRSHQSFYFHGMEETIRVDVAELDVAAGTVVAWREEGKRLVAMILSQSS